MAGQVERPWMRSGTEIKSQNLTPNPMPMVGNDAQLFLAPPGHSIDGTDKWKPIEGDSNQFDAIVDFGLLFYEREMLASIIPETERWKEYEQGSARLLEYHPDTDISRVVREAADTIVETVNPHDGRVPHLDPELIATYKGEIDTIVHLQGQIAGGRLALCTPLVPLRASEPIVHVHNFDDGINND